MSPLAATPIVARQSTGAGKIRVMICDDSAVVRGFITRLFEREPDIEIVVTANNGEAAIRGMEHGPIDVAILDVEMPVMDGLTALPKLLAIDKNLQVIVASTLTLRNAQISLQALAAGAAEYVPKPSTSSELNGSTEFRRELLDKVRTLGCKRRSLRGGSARAGERTAPATASGSGFRAASSAGGAFALRKASTHRPQILAIGSSTGGPQALVGVLSALATSVDVPIVITQHMPATFTAILAEHLGRASRRETREGVEGETLRNGRIYVAPGGQHMKLEQRGRDCVVRLSQEPPENFCRPAVDPLFRSVAQVFGPSALAVVLTGMGADGAKGSKMVADAGGTVIAQDEATSVVWGMPGATAQSGSCSAVLPLAEIAPRIGRLFAGGAS